MAAKPDIDPAVFDAGLLAVVQNLIPPDRVHTYLRDLDRQFKSVVNMASTEPTLRSRAHKIVSQAGMLGLTRMSDCARQVEDACRAGIGQAAAVLQCRQAIADVRLYAMPAARASTRQPPATNP